MLLLYNENLLMTRKLIDRPSVSPSPILFIFISFVCLLLSLNYKYGTIQYSITFFMLADSAWHILEECFIFWTTAICMENCMLKMLLVT